MSGEKDAEKDNRDSEPPKLHLKDYIALAAAAIETFLFPLLAMAVVIAVLATFFALRP